MSKARVVIAVGNSALRQRGSQSAVSEKLLQDLCRTIAKLANKYEIVLAPAASTQLQLDTSTRNPQPLTYEIAMQQGSTGFQFTQALDNELAKSHRTQKSIGLVTRVVVDRSDAAFRHPSFLVGQCYNTKESLHLTKTRNWSMQETPAGFRRLVPSPSPIDVIEAKSIASLLQSGSIIVAMGCGGVPVIRTKILKTLKAVEAVVAPELAAAKLARLIRADIFVTLIDLPNIYLNYQQGTQLPLGYISKREMENLIHSSAFDATILPKIQTAFQFAGTNRTSIITSPRQLELSLARRAGTFIQVK